MDNCSGSLQAASNGQFAAFLFLQVLSGHYRWTIFISTLFPFFKIAQNYRLECVCFTLTLIYKQINLAYILQLSCRLLQQTTKAV